MKSSGIMSIVNEYAIYILIKLCTSGVKESPLEYPSYSVYIVIVYLNSPLFGASKLHPLNIILSCLTFTILLQCLANQRL